MVRQSSVIVRVIQLLFFTSLSPATSTQSGTVWSACCEACCEAGHRYFLQHLPAELITFSAALPPAPNLCPGRYTLIKQTKQHNRHMCSVVFATWLLLVWRCVQCSACGHFFCLWQIKTTYTCVLPSVGLWCGATTFPEGGVTNLLGSMKPTHRAPT